MKQWDSKTSISCWECLHSSSEQTCPPVIDGRNLKQIASCKGFSNSPNSGIVLMKEINFPFNPTTKADYAACGSDSAIVDNNFSCSIQPSTRLSM